MKSIWVGVLAISALAVVGGCVAKAGWNEQTVIEQPGPCTLTVYKSDLYTDQGKRRVCAKRDGDWNDYCAMYTWDNRIRRWVAEPGVMSLQCLARDYTGGELVWPTTHEIGEDLDTTETRYEPHP